MKDEEHHIDFLETQLDLVGKLGVELYSQHHIGELEDDRETELRRAAPVNERLTARESVMDFAGLFRCSRGRSR